MFLFWMKMAYLLTGLMQIKLKLKFRKNLYRWNFMPWARIRQPFVRIRSQKKVIKDLKYGR